MPTLTPGNDIVVLKPNLWWAPLYTKIPKAGLPLNQDWATLVDPLWVKIKDTINGIQVTNRAPIIPIVSEERDRIGSVRGGGGGGGRGGGGAAAAAGAGTAIAFQALTFTEAFWLKANYMTKATAAAAAEVVSMTFLTAATANGNLDIGLGATDGLTTTHTPVAVTSATQSTAILVATAVRGTSFTGWTTGGTGATVTFTSTATGPRGPHSFGAAGTGVTVGASDPSVTTAGHYALNASYIDQDADHSVMVGFEGRAKAGSIFSQDTIIRGFGYRCENTQNGIDVWRRTGADAVIKPNLVLECIPADTATLAGTMTTGTGVTATLIDPDGKFNYFWTNETGP